jgi:hypothetical protein
MYRGDGIYKSSDNGSSWTLLPSTSSGTPQTSDRFDYVWNVATDPANLIQDVVYAATYNGIYRSTNGGGSWSTAIAADSSFTDVAVSSTGVAYAYTRNGNLSRVWRSTDGSTWTAIQPPTFPTSAGRTIIGITPSDPNLLYFYVQGANNTPAVATHQLWKYRYISGDGSGSGGAWENRGASLPSDINSQTGYDMVVHIKPTDTNFVIIGGTNLYRSTNGFANTSTTTTIGGYPYWPGQNHHPDLHSGFFKPGNPNIYYSGHDGGLSRTDNINAGSVTWANLDNGYNVTQFYSIAIAPDSGSNLILGGAQDNGSLLGTQPGVSAWSMVFGGDGTVVKIAPVSQNRLYTQYQNGPMQRQNLDGSNYVDITPSGSSNQLFVNPIILDPNNPAILYYAAGSSTLTSAIWRTDDAPNATSGTGWTLLSSTDVGNGSGYTRRITALGISKANNANVLYYGTVDGVVKRAVNANTASPTVTDITPPGIGGGTSVGGFVRCVAVDPINSNKALVVFGNYNFQSLWYTTNGGTDWSDVEGNLSGATGPSTRWGSIFYVDGVMQVFLGTSIGVLSTNALNGASTVWVQQAASEIGNVIVGYMDYRSSDKTLAVGTHAIGAFTVKFGSALAVGQNYERPLRFALKQNYPNPFNPTTVIRYELPEAEMVSLKVYDMMGREVAILANGRIDAGIHRVKFSATNLASGVYLYTLRSKNYSVTKKLLLVR